MKKRIIPNERIESKIYIIRGKKIMFDFDLSKLYGVDNRHLKRQVRRNKRRFPNDFMFSLNDNEIKQMVRHFGTPFRSILGGYRPYVFTEHGILMLSSVLNSERAIDVNIQIMRAFTKIRELMMHHRKIWEKIEGMEKKYDGQFRIVFDAIKKLIEEPVKKHSKKIGFLK